MSCRVSPSVRVRIVLGAAVFGVVEGALATLAVLKVGGRFSGCGIAGVWAQAGSDSEVPSLWATQTSAGVSMEARWETQREDGVGGGRLSLFASRGLLPAQSSQKTWATYLCRRTLPPSAYCVVAVAIELKSTGGTSCVCLQEGDTTAMADRSTEQVRVPAKQRAVEPATSQAPAPAT